MEIKKAKIEDAKELSALAKEIWHECYPSVIGEELTEYLVQKLQTESAIKNQLEKGMEYFKLEDRNKSIGFLGIEIKEEKLLISKLYIKKEFRSFGYGKQAFEFAKEYATDMGVKALYLFVNKKNKKAQASYEKWGLKKIRGHVFDVGNGFVMDDYEYEIKL